MAKSVEVRFEEYGEVTGAALAHADRRLRCSRQSADASRLRLSDARAIAPLKKLRSSQNACLTQRFSARAALAPMQRYVLNTIATLAFIAVYVANTPSPIMFATLATERLAMPLKHVSFA